MLLPQPRDQPPVTDQSRKLENELKNGSYIYNNDIMSGETLSDEAGKLKRQLCVKCTLLGQPFCYFPYSAERHGENLLSLPVFEFEDLLVKLLPIKVLG